MKMNEVKRGFKGSEQRTEQTHKTSPPIVIARKYKKLCPKSKIVGIFSCRLNDDGMYAYKNVNTNIMPQNFKYPVR